jgi:hypothetical protein
MPTKRKIASEADLNKMQLKEAPYKINGRKVQCVSAAFDRIKNHFDVV